MRGRGCWHFSGNALLKRLLKLTTFALTLITIAGCAFVVWLCHQQALIFAYPPRQIAQNTPGDFEISDWRNVQFATRDELTLQGWYIPPDEGSSSILFVHGHGGNRAQLLAVAAWLRSEGYGALLFDLRNHGTSEGDVTSMGLLETEDVLAAFHFLQSQAEVDPERIGIYGVSMGAAAAIRAFSQLPQVQALIVESTYADITGVIAEGITTRTGLPGFPFAPVITWMTGNLAEASLFNLHLTDAVAQIAPRPLLILHGTADPLIPVTQAQVLYEAAGDPKEIHIVQDGVHGGLRAVNPESYDQHVLNFIRRYL